MTKQAIQPDQPSSVARVEQLYAEHAAMVWGGLRKLGVPDASIEDAVQDVFLVAHRRLADFEGRSSIKTWLYGIVLRVAKDHRRAQIRHAQRVERLAELLSVSPASSPVRDAERREANRALHAILAELDPGHREILVLVDIEDFSVRDAAAMLGMHLRACQRRLRAARAAFEKKLARYLQPSRDGEAGLRPAEPNAGRIGNPSRVSISADGEAGLRPAEPKRGKEWKPSKGSHSDGGMAP